MPKAGRSGGSSDWVRPFLQAHGSVLRRLVKQLELSGSRVRDVFNIAWGEDIGDDYEHITSNISPSLEGASVDLFSTDEIARIIDPVRGDVLWETDGRPSVR
jgi:hypothetical protein